MHELSLALEVCRLAGEVLERESGTAVRAIGVEVGADAGIEVANFRFCLEALLTEPPLAGARAEILPSWGDTLRLAYVEVDDGRPND
jgi:Zn finger protein HypA/HybF involved in hydrogenase expression